MIVKENVDYDNFKSGIKEAADSCPVGVIRFEEE
jgi:ferredoxin